MGQSTSVSIVYGCEVFQEPSQDKQEELYIDGMHPCDVIKKLLGEELCGSGSVLSTDVSGHVEWDRCFQTTMLVVRSCSLYAFDMQPVSLKEFSPAGPGELKALKHARKVLEELGFELSEPGVFAIAHTG